MSAKWWEGRSANFWILQEMLKGFLCLRHLNWATERIGLLWKKTEIVMQSTKLSGEKIVLQSNPGIGAVGCGAKTNIKSSFPPIKIGEIHWSGRRRLHLATEHGKWRIQNVSVSQSGQILIIPLRLLYGISGRWASSRWIVDLIFCFVLLPP